MLMPMRHDAADEADECHYYAESDADEPLGRRQRCAAMMPTKMLPMLPRGREMLPSHERCRGRQRR